jgi:nucleotide-binding universal stress UspA family protein
MSAPQLPRHILCAVDFSEISAHALAYADAIARAAGADLTALYAETVQMPPYFTESQIDELRRQYRDSLVEAETSLRRFLEARLGPAAGRIRTQVVEAAPVEGILAAASQLGADLIALGTHGRTGINRWLLGSVAERVLRASRLPVLTARGPAQPAPVAIRRILVPVNDSELARRSLELAALLAKTLGAALTVMHVREAGSSHRVADLCAWVPPEDRALCQVRELDREGEAAEEILKAAAETGCDLLVIGARHRAFFDSTVIGTTTVRVVRHAPCPVLTLMEPAGASQSGS